MPVAERSADAAVSEWTALLDRFEADLREPSPGVWGEAASPLPPELADRARRVLAAQRERIQRLERERDETLGHLAALRRIPADIGERPAYLDLDG
jgi:hypothetical protein